MIQPDYSKLLHTKEWKAKREMILIRDNNECACCHKSKKILYVHHKYYMANRNGIKVMPWEYPNEALITVCYTCHKQLHKTTSVVVRYVA